MTRERTFASTPNAVAHARRFVAGELPDVPRLVADEIAIMVSELATNCVRHAVTDFAVRIEQTGSRIRISVTDGGGGRPTVRSPGPFESSGRGLRIVLALADSFGVEELPGTRGKTVWFVVDLEEHGTTRAQRGARAKREPAGERSSGPDDKTLEPRPRRSRGRGRSSPPPEARSVPAGFQPRARRRSGARTRVPGTTV